jgi:chromosome segregation ATPase
VKNKQTLLLRVAKKLSPMRVFQKTTASSKTMSLNSGSTNSATDGEYEALKSSLQAAYSRIESLERENSELLEELETKEDLIRSEVALEMEERFRETRRKHQEKYEQLQAHLDRESSNTAFTVKMDRAESQLEELMDKVDECEKEMIRMNQDHNHKVNTLEREVSHLQDKLAEAIVAKLDGDAKIEILQEELNYGKRNNQERPKQMTPQTMNRRLDEEVIEEENIPNETVKENWTSSSEPLKFKRAVTKKVYRKNPRQKNRLRIAENNGAP